MIRTDLDQGGEGGEGEPDDPGHYPTDRATKKGLAYLPLCRLISIYLAPSKPWLAVVLDRAQQSRDVVYGVWGTK